MLHNGKMKLSPASAHISKMCLPNGKLLHFGKLCALCMYLE